MYSGSEIELLIVDPCQVTVLAPGCYGVFYLRR